MTAPTVGSTFSGIGGMDLGLHRAGWDVRWQVEIDEYRRRVLARHWPDVPKHGDITTVDPGGLEPVHLLCGGFPCQDLSVAGARAGLAGKRSSLFFQFARFAGALRPRWLLIENVPGLLSICSCRGCHRCGVLLRWHNRPSRVNPEGITCRCGACATAHALREAHRGSDFRLILGTLESIGYGVAWRMLDSQYFGVPQRRRRVYIVGHLGAACPPEILFEPDSSAGDSQASTEASKGTAFDSPNGIARSLQHVGGGDDYGANKGTVISVPLRTKSNRQGSPERSDVTLITETPRVGVRDKGAGDSSDNTPIIVLNARQDPDTSVGVTHGLDSGFPGPVVAFRKGTGAHTVGSQDESWESADEANPLVGDRRSTTLIGTPADPDGVREATGTPRRVDSDGRRYAGLGDAVTVTVAQWIGQRILAWENR